jgi:hypothetical protein
LSRADGIRVNVDVAVVVAVLDSASRIRHFSEETGME